jgi:hypothetical protein
MRRRSFLTASAVGIAGLAGCSGGSDNETEAESTPTATEEPTATEAMTAMETETPTPTATEAMSMDLSSPESAVETFYGTLYGNDDIDATNGLYHPESPAPELKPADFEPFGGVENIQADIQSTEIVAEGEGTAQVHAEVDYTTPAGSATNTDWFYLAQSDGDWLVNIWLPASSRQPGESGALATPKATVETFYQVLYGNDDIEGANELYHPESDAPELKAEDFEPYGGVEAIEADLQSMEVVEEGEGTARVHAEVDYTTPAGSATNTDYFDLRFYEGAFLVDAFIPESARGDGGGTATASDDGTATATDSDDGTATDSA